MADKSAIPRRVVIHLDMTSVSDRLVLLGIADHVGHFERWALDLIDRGVDGRSCDHGLSGIIFAPGANAPSTCLAGESIPIVSIGHDLNVPFVQQVIFDEARAAALAVATIVDCSPAQCATFGADGPEGEAFENVMRQAFFANPIRAICLDPPDRPDDLQALAQRLLTCKKPLGVVTRTMRHAHKLREACLLAGIVMPGEVSIISMTSEPSLAGLVPPRLACLADGSRLLGKAAAGELARLIAGGSVSAAVAVAPTSINRGESLAGTNVRDEVVAAALQFIRANAHREIRTGDLLTELECSRRNLERRFKLSLGYGPATAIRNARLSYAHRLLSETALPMKAIAKQCGFAGPEQLRRNLRAATSLTPSEYRQAHAVVCE